MKILITGGAGFIGSHLSQQLRMAGHDVLIYDKASPDAASAGSLRADVRDLAALTEASRGVDVIYNLAAEHRDDVRPLSLYEEVNVGGARNLVAAAQANDVRTIIFTSSVAVYGDSDHPLNEQAPHAFINEYGRTKSAAEKVHLEWVERARDRRLVMVRPSVVFGPGNRGNVYNLLNQIARGRFVMVGGGENRKSMAYVENVAAFLTHVLNGPAGVSIFNYADTPDFDMNTLVAQVRENTGRGTGVGLRLPLSLARLLGVVADLIASATGRNLPISSIRVRKFAANTEVDASLSRATGFEAPIPLQVGLTRTLAKEFPR